MNDLPELEILCPECRNGYGKKWRDTCNNLVTCDSCDGYGYVLTPFGQRVLEMMEHRGVKFRRVENI